MRWLLGHSSPTLVAANIPAGRPVVSKVKRGAVMELEVVFLEDPACSWCWAFQPVETTFLFEWGEQLRWRMVMAGLRDHPVPDPSLIIRHWQTASAVSGMPFEPDIWNSHIL